MSENKDSWYNHPWLLVLGGALLTSPLFIDWIKGIPITSTFSSIWHWIKEVMNINVKLWVVILIVILVIAVLILLIKSAINSAGKDLKIDNDALLNYKGDKFGDLTWKWTWKQNPYTHKYEPVDPTPLCNTGKCNFSELVMDDNYTFVCTYLCNNCKKYYQNQITPNKAAEHILLIAYQKFSK